MNKNKQHKIYEIIIDIATRGCYRKLSIASKLIDYVIKNFVYPILKQKQMQKL